MTFEEKRKAINDLRNMAIPEYSPLYSSINLAIETIANYDSTEKVGQWIPVSERYPEDGQRVLVDYCDEDAGIMLIRFNVNGYRGFKAWMPLPERYKEVEE